MNQYEAMSALRAVRRTVGRMVFRDRFGKEIADGC